MKILNNFKKLNRADLGELMAKVDQIQKFAYIVQSLSTSKAIWVSQKIKDLGLDTTKTYNIDFKTGRLVPIVEPEPKPVEEPKK